MKKTRIAFIEDQYDVAEALFSAISSASDFCCIARYDCAEDAMGAIEKDCADIYLVDLGLPGMSGIDFIEQAKHHLPDTDFIVHTLSESGQNLIDALAAGAVGYVVKGENDQQLLDDLAVVVAGGALINPRMARRLIHHYHDIGPQKKALTKTETDVLEKLKTGMTYDQISEANHVSRSTIQTHIKNIYKKLHVNNRDDAVRTGVMFGVIV